MKSYTISTAARLTALTFAFVTSALVLGSTVAGMQSGQSGAELVALDRVTITAPRI